MYWFHNILELLCVFLDLLRSEYLQWNGIECNTHLDVTQHTSKRARLKQGSYQSRYCTVIAVCGMV